MKVLLYQLDGKLPNIALMRISAHHKALGDEVELRKTPRSKRLLWDSGEELVYGSLIFERTRARGQELLDNWPNAHIGGTGWNLTNTLESLGIGTNQQDYTIYPEYPNSIGFSQRGCRLKCKFCVVPQKEGAVKQNQTIGEIWRGYPWPRNIILLDNDFFGQKDWRKRIKELQEGNFKVSFNQGINVRFITNESAAAIASVNYRDGNMKRRCIYTAWDNKKDESRLFKGLECLVREGVKPRHIMVYMLIAYWPWDNEEDWLYRAKQLRKFGADPYPMPYVRNKMTVGFQRWILGAYDKRISWSDWKEAKYNPYNLSKKPQPLLKTNDAE